MKDLKTVLGYYANPAEMVYGEQLLSLPSASGINALSSDKGVFQSAKQAAACKRLAELVENYEIELSDDAALSVQSVLGGCTFGSSIGTTALSVIICSSTDVPTISSKNSLSKLGRNLAAFRQEVSEQIESQNGDGAACFTAITKILINSEVSRAVWQGKADLSKAKATVRRGGTKTTIEIEEDTFVSSKKTVDPTTVVEGSDVK